MVADIWFCHSSSYKAYITLWVVAQRQLKPYIVSMLIKTVIFMLLLLLLLLLLRAHFYSIFFPFICAVCVFSVGYSVIRVWVSAMNLVCVTMFELRIYLYNAIAVHSTIAFAVFFIHSFCLFASAKKKEPKRDIFWMARTYTIYSVVVLCRKYVIKIDICYMTVVFVVLLLL